MSARRLKYLASRDHGITCDYPVQAFQRALSARGIAHFTIDQTPVFFTGRVLAKLKLLRNFAHLSHNAYFVPIMQLSEARLFPVCYFAETIVFAMDCWPPRYHQWLSYFRRQRMKVAFITARQSADYMRQHVPGLDVIWLPEAIEIESYRSDQPLKDRPIDILEMGRRHAPYHDAITAHCAAHGYHHLYATPPTALIFPGFDELVRGLNDSKISICFPSSMTHPARSGDVETLTLRYLETIASRCIPLGHCPAEMADLFGYNPVVEADPNDPAGQIDSILANLSDYEPLIERNFKRMTEVATWEVRADQLLAYLRERGYDVCGDK